MAEGCKCIGVFRVMFQNPQLGKVMLAAGLQAAASSVAISFVAADQKARYWGEHQSSMQARFAMLMSLAGICGGSLYGRFSDSVDRRLAAGIYGLLTFLPAWPYMLMGLTSAALTVSSILQIAACFGEGSNVMLVLAQDVAKPDEHEAAFGAFYMVNSFVNFIFLGIPILLILVLKVVPVDPHLCLWYQVALSAGFFFCILSLKMPPPKHASTSSPQGLWQDSLPETRQCESHLPGFTSKGHCRDGCLGQALRKVAHSLIEPLRLGCADRNIRASCWAAAFIAFSGDLVMDIGGQYFQDSLGILPVQNHHVNQRAETTVSVLSMLPPQLAIIPGYALAAWAMKRLGSRRLVLILIPVSALLTSVGAFFQFWPSNITLGFTVVLLTYASLVNMPLFAFIHETAPQGRVGEAMGAVGSCQQISNFVGNGMVNLLNPVLLRDLGNKGFWVYYPACGLLTLAALAPILLVKTADHSSSPDGRVDSGSVVSTEASSKSTDSHRVSV